MRKLLSFGLLLMLCLIARAQEGCTDPLASNFEAGASINDGSCEYTTTDYSLIPLGNLPGTIKECSGLTWMGDQLWAHNDGGNTPILFQLDTLDGSVLRSVRLAPGNWDWEDLAASEENIYIGDFGNNDGSRQNLRIYRITKSQLQQDTIWTVDTISFAFADQTDFAPAQFDTPYDCEAFFYKNDSLHVFTKDWVAQKTRHYIFPALPGHYDILPRDSFEVNGLITAADIAPDGVITLLGYNASESFLWLLFDYQEAAIFSGNKRKIGLGTFTSLGQTEGIAFSRSGEGYIASEELLSYPAQLFKFTSSQWTDPLTTTAIDPVFQIHISPNSFTDFLSIDNKEDEAIDFLIFDIVGRQVAARRIKAESQQTWYLSYLAPGYYHLLLIGKKKTRVLELVKY